MKSSHFVVYPVPLEPWAERYSPLCANSAPQQQERAAPSQRAPTIGNCWPCTQPSLRDLCRLPSLPSGDASPQASPARCSWWDRRTTTTSRRDPLNSPPPPAPTVATRGRPDTPRTVATTTVVALAAITTAVVDNATTTTTTTTTAAAATTSSSSSSSGRQASTSQGPTPAPTVVPATPIGSPGDPDHPSHPNRHDDDDHHHHSHSRAPYAHDRQHPLPLRPMPRSSPVSEEVWAKAVHAVKVQKMSLRQAAQLYGVHHMSLHRRVRGRYATSLPETFDIRAYLTPDDEAEVLGVLREQFLHEKRITSDDIRFVVRAIASQGGKRVIPVEFPPSRWILEFKRAHGFSKLNSYAYPPLGTRDEDMEDVEDSASNYSGYSQSSSSFHHDDQSDAPNQDRDNRNDRQQHQQPPPPRTENGANDREDVSSHLSNSSYDTGMTTGSSSGGSYENGETEKRPYRLSHTVPAETWEKAIAAVEQQGMSLRAAAKMYGVHFAALHRRVKKRAQGEQTPATDGYFNADDEAGIVRVVIARAELGVLMTFDELMDLVQRAALRNLPDLSVEAARTLMSRFQSRNEHSVRHIIADWPQPRSSATSYRQANASNSIRSGISNAGFELSTQPPRNGTSGMPGRPRHGGTVASMNHSHEHYNHVNEATSSSASAHTQSPLPPLFARSEYTPPRQTTSATHLPRAYESHQRRSILNDQWHRLHPRERVYRSANSDIQSPCSDEDAQSARSGEHRHDGEAGKGEGDDSAVMYV